MPIERVKTGIEGFDQLIGGGFPRDSFILLCGNAGTGKTIFSAHFLYHGAANLLENGVYVSFGESRDAFYANMQSFGFDFEGLEREDRFRLLDMLAVKEEGISTILNMIIAAVSRINARRLVIDSYSALSQACKDPLESRIIIQTVAGKIMREMGCTTLLIEEVPVGSERIGFGVEEFVADGVIMLKASELEGRLIRSLKILKLRGTKLKQNKSVFTLDGGFKVFTPFEYKPIEKPKRFQLIPDKPEKYSTGSILFDEVLGGGLPKGSIMLLETDERIAVFWHSLLVCPIVANFITQARGYVCFPSMGVDPLLLRNIYRQYGITDEELKNQMRVFVPFEVHDSPLNVIEIKGENWKEDLDKFLEAGRQFIEQTKQPPIFLLGADSLKTIYGEERCEQILNLCATEVRRMGAVAIYITKAGYRDLAVKLSALADTYIRLTRRHGCLLLYGVKPRTPIYAVEMDTSKGYPLPRLTAIL